MNQNIQKEILQISKGLISFRATELNFSEKEACLGYIERYFKKISKGIYIKKIASRKYTGILISNSRNYSPDILLNGHIDVVGGEAEQFKPKIIKNKLYGRGSIDMKGAVAVFMVLMKKIIQEKMDKKVMLMLVGDEEIPNVATTDYLINNLNLRPKFTIVGEETDFDIVTSQKGNLNIKVEAKGRSVHSAFPEKGVNALEKCIKFYEGINNLKSFKEKTDYANTIALTYLRGGEAINSIPNSAQMGINIRLISKKTLNEINNYINKYKNRVKTGFNIKTYYSGSMMEDVTKQEQIKQLKKAITEVVRLKPKQTKTSTSSDARYFSSKKMPVVVFGPRGAKYHEEGEYVEISSLMIYYRILYQLIQQSN